MGVNILSKKETNSKFNPIVTPATRIQRQSYSRRREFLPLRCHSSSWILLFIILVSLIWFVIFIGNADVQASLTQVRERWRALRHETRSERQRMERLLQLWREYQTGVDELVDWLMSILSLMRNDEICDDSLDMLEAQLEQLRVSYFSMATSRRCTIFLALLLSKKYWAERSSSECRINKTKLFYLMLC